MKKAHEHLKDRVDALATLKKILNDCDPASGVTFKVRRGVARDNPDYSDDDARRPWVPIETGEMGLIQDVGAILKVALEHSIEFWKDTTTREIEEATKQLELS